MKFFYIEQITISCDTDNIVSVDMNFQLEGDNLDRRISIMEDGTIVNSGGPGGGESLVAEMRSSDLRELAQCIEIALDRLRVVYQMAAALNTCIVENKIPPTPAEAANRG